MWPKGVVDIRVPRRDDGDRFVGPPMIKLEFDKYTLDEHIIIGRESIQLRMKRKRPILCERCLQFGHLKSSA